MLDGETSSPWCKTLLICPSPFAALLHSAVGLRSHEQRQSSALNWFSMVFNPHVITEDLVRQWMSGIRLVPRTTNAESDIITGQIDWRRVENLDFQPDFNHQ